MKALAVVGLTVVLMFAGTGAAQAKHTAKPWKPSEKVATVVTRIPCPVWTTPMQIGNRVYCIPKGSNIL